MMKQITKKEDKEFFRREIKKELRKVIANVDEDDNLDSCYRLWLYNSKDEYFVRLKQDFTFSEYNLFIKSNGTVPIVIGELYDFRIELNKATTDRELERFANKIINEYNQRVRLYKIEKIKIKF